VVKDKVGRLPGELGVKKSVQISVYKSMKKQMPDNQAGDRETVMPVIVKQSQT